VAASFDPRQYRSPRPAGWLIRALIPLNRLVLRYGLGLERIELPAADLARLRACVRPGSRAFIGPNHPEFTTDWLLDKELSARAAPLMAHWASYEIVNASPLAQRFWLANNLIANAPGGAGRADSLRWARTGHGVLLHPEGTATWTADRVAPLLPGIAEMAVAAAADGAPTWVVPVVWRLVFTRDPWPGLAREMAHIERHLGLGPGRTLPPEQRYARLHGRLLALRAARLGLPAPACDPEAPGAAFLAARDAHVAQVRSALAALTGPLAQDLARAQHTARQALRALAATDAGAAARGRELLRELQRLQPLDAARLGRGWLGPEAVAEDLKRTRAALLTRGWREVLHNTLPVAVAPRIAHLRVPEPLAIGAGDDPGQVLTALHARLQGGVDALGAQCAAALGRWRRPNPMAPAR
jgi:hypothetical protein